MSQELSLYTLFILYDLSWWDFKFFSAGYALFCPFRISAFKVFDPYLLLDWTLLDLITITT
jgi:hypothetical protein